MNETSEPEMRRLASAVAGGSLEAGAAFRTVGPIPGNPSVGEILSGLARRAIARHRTSFPAYPYVVLTNDEIVVLDFRFDRAIRVVGAARWPVSSIQVLEAEPELRRLVLRLPSHDAQVVLEGLFRSPAERDVVARLQASTTSF